MSEGPDLKCPSADYADFNESLTLENALRA